MDYPMLKCGCIANSIHKNDHDGLGEDHPSCVIHDCCKVVEMPSLEGRKARCAYYGKKVKVGAYNGNCCNVCKAGGICQCEQPSSPKLWFFQSKPDQEYDEFYCACQGAD